MAKKNVWVSPRSDGTWEVQREGAQRRDGVEVIIQRGDGRIQGRESYGNDPFPPRDTEH